MKTDKPVPPTVENESVPEPSVVKACPFEPSLVGNVIASLIVREAGTEPTYTIASDTSFFSVYTRP